MLSHTEILTRLLLSALLGGIIGFDRERLLWTAGIRTHMLVCTGACLFMLVSAFGFSDILGTAHVELDPSRIAAGVVSGVGFLGAGSILRQGNHVRGLTTAASIWAVAAIGLATGAGMVFAAAASTVLLVAILAGLKPVEEAYRARRQSCSLRVSADPGVLGADRLAEVLNLRESQVRRFIVEFDRATGQDELRVLLERVSSRDVAGMADRLRALPGVHHVRAAGRSVWREGADKD